jgi:hypothetical protein
VRPAHKSVEALFFMLRWDPYGFHKKHVRTRYTELVVFCIRWDVRVMLYISVCPGCETSSHYFSYSGRPGAVSIKSAPGHVMPKLCFFASGEICGSRSAFWCVWAVKHRSTIFHARVVPVQIQQKMHWDRLHQTCVFVSIGIYGSHSAFWCTKH